MNDPRVEQYARLLVDTCVRVQPGWQVIVAGSVYARPLLEEVTRQVARKGAHAIVRVNFGGTLFASREWVREAPLELVETPSSIEHHAISECDAIIVVEAPENTRDASSVDQERLAALQTAYRPSLERI